jgi:anti-anti-sigma regulatory factor
VSGELDTQTISAYAARLDAALLAGHPILVDLGDCTFIDGRGARFLVNAHGRAASVGTPFFVVLPFSAAPSVRRTLLEFVPDLVAFPIIPRQHDHGQTGGGYVGAAGDDHRLRRLRAGFWEAGARRERLLADRDALILTQRQMLEAYRASTRDSRS